MKKLKVGDLSKIKEKVKNSRTLKAEGTTTRITVHMGTCGIAAGANEILATFIDEIKGKKLKRIAITTSGCAGFCSREPMATIEIYDQPPVKYVSLSVDKVRKIVSEHLVKGNIVRDYALAIGFEQSAV